MGIRIESPEGVSRIDAEGWIEGLMSGDEAAVRAFVDAYYEPILRYLARLLQEVQAAEDVCQEVFVRAIQRIDQLRNPAGLKTWLYRIATNMAHDHRARMRETPVVEIEVADEGAGESDARAIRERLFVAGLLQRLSVEQREVVILRYYEDLSLPSIAEVLGVPVGTVKSRLHHALRLLRRVVESEEERIQHVIEQRRTNPSHVG